MEKKNVKYNKFIEMMGEEVRVEEDLSKYTTFKIGGKADLFYSVKNEDSFIRVVKVCDELEIPFVVMGCGSNILVSDEGYRGLVIKNENKGNIGIFDEDKIFVNSGLSLSELLEFSADNSLAGLDLLAGIPGSVGGAVYMNAGAFGCTIDEHILYGKVLDKSGNLYELNRKDFSFGYRSSRLQKSGEILVSIVLRLIRGEKEKIYNKMNEIIEIRRKKHPDKTVPCAGSYFKNIIISGQVEKREPAGYYLDKAGLKGMQCGEAKVFEKHANFIINTGEAKSSDVLKLAQIMKDKVKETFGIELIEEVVYLDDIKGFTNEILSK